MVDGVVGPITKQRLVTGNLSHDQVHDSDAGGLQVHRRVTLRWHLDSDSVPSDLPARDVEAELAKAFSVWARPSGIRFVQAKTADEAQISIAFADHSPKNAFLFDGPGGALAEASSSAITFDETERWGLSSGRQKVREPLTWDDQQFELLTIAIHEIGHLLGLQHSADPADVMNPYYLAGRTTLSANDLACLREAVPDAPPGSSGIKKSSTCVLL